MKTINLELCKKLTEAGILDNIETEYYINSQWVINENLFNNKHLKSINAVKTLTCEEAYDILPNKIWEKYLNIQKAWNNLQYFEVDENSIPIDDWETIESSWKTLLDDNQINTEKLLLEAIEKMIEYLLENNLFNKN